MKQHFTPPQRAPFFAYVHVTHPLPSIAFTPMTNPHAHSGSTLHMSRKLSALSQDIQHNPFHALISLLTAARNTYASGASVELCPIPDVLLTSASVHDFVATNSRAGSTRLSNLAATSVPRSNTRGRCAHRFAKTTLIQLRSAMSGQKPSGS